MFRELSARRARRRWVREMHRRLEELDRVDREHGLGAWPTPRTVHPSAPVGAPRSAPLGTRRSTRRSHGPVWPSLLVTFLVLAGVLLLLPGGSGDRVRALLNLDQRLANVVDAPRGEGEFAFLQTQPGSEKPVGYNPCKEIEYVVNPEGAPEGYEELVEDSVAEVNAATGLRLAYGGTTDERSFADHRYAALSREPVLILWATPEEVPGLAGDVAGLGGSASVTRTPGHRTYVTGSIALDRDFFAELATRPGGVEQQRAIVLHELGHVVGLGHVDDPSELMYGESLGRTSFGPGDLEGLARLGAVDCW